MRSNGIGYGPGSDQVRSYGDRLNLDFGSSRNRVDRVSGRVVVELRSG